jgi:hypothetical protein
MQFGAKATAKEEVRRVEARRNNLAKESFHYQIGHRKGGKEKKNRDGERRKQRDDRGRWKVGDRRSIASGPQKRS